MILAGEGELPGRIGELADIATGQADGQAEQACSQLIAEAIHFMKVAAGKTSDALHLNKREEDKRKDRAAANRGSRYDTGTFSWHRQGQASASASRRCSSAEPNRGQHNWEWQRPEPPKAAKTGTDWGSKW